MMMTGSVATRRRRLIGAVGLAIALAMGVYGFGADERQGLYRVIGLLCAVGSVVSVVRAVQIFRLPDDHLRALEPDPRNDPETRARRFALASLLATTGVIAIVCGIGGFGFDGAVWWRVMLIITGWPLLVAGSIWLVLTSREGQVRTRA